jgi:hypothetical protein
LRFQLWAKTTTGRPLDHPSETCGREWRATLAEEYEGSRWALALMSAPFFTRRTWSSAPFEVDLVSPQVADLSRPESVTEGQQDHSRVPMAVTVGLRRSSVIANFSIDQRKQKCALFFGQSHGH